MNLRIDGGTTVGLVGESGSGKSTFGRLVLRLLDPTAGTIYVAAVTSRACGATQLRMLRHEVQIVFQDPRSAVRSERDHGQCAARTDAGAAIPLGRRAAQSRP